MQFSDLADYFQKLEATTSRNSITEILAELYKKLSAHDAQLVSYLLQGRVAPIFEPIEFGLADKMMVKAIALASGEVESDVFDLFKSLGDLGSVAEKIKHKTHHAAKQMTIAEVFADLHSIAIAGGKGSQDQKLAMLAGLINHADPVSAKYIVRIPLGKLRLGFSDMTILDALSWMLVGSKEKRKVLEKAYNVRPDLGFIAQTVKESDDVSLSKTRPVPGTPILMARANRLSSSEEIFEKIGECAVEFKYDGLRLQIHKKGERVWIFSRNLENVSHMFPDVVEAVKKQIAADVIIFEGEVVAFDPKTGALMPFQETSQRKRKYDVAQKAEEIPVQLFAFELLLLEKTDYLTESYIERKKMLKKSIKQGEIIQYAQETIATTDEKIDELFLQSVKGKFEGIIAKKLDGEYEAGVRGWNWIKYKRAMNEKLIDTIDAVIMGYTKGEGKRTEFGIGQFLAGVYDEKNDQFLTITKVGTGLSDDQFKELAQKVKKFEVKEQPNNYSVDKMLVPDVWLKPEVVVELASDEITRSQVHTAGRTLKASKSGSAFDVDTPGYALRFPRLVKFRDDKSATDATTVKEVATLFKKQK